MRITEQRKTLIANILECLVHCILLVVVAAVAYGANTSLTAVVIVTAVCVVVSIAVKLAVMRRIDQNVHWYISILDTIPFMMHATDMDMNWIFMNKATADFLKLDRDKMMGQHCSNWKAAICGTDRCSAQCLRNGNPTTFFEQNGLDLRVDTNWLHDKKQNRIGYVEVVQDISSMVEIQKQQENLVGRIRGVYDSLVAASQEIDTDSQALAQGSLEQASAIEQLSCSIVEVKHENEQNLSKTEVAANLAGTIQQDAEKGGEQMQRMTAAVDEITGASRAINNVMKVIDDIAFQTNILALNASVEAARAGVHGKGFAVVAGEVRNLAIKSAEAAKNTSELIQNSISKAELGAQISDDTAQFLQKIIADIQESTRVIQEIAESSRRQNEAISQINEGIMSVSQVIQMNSTTAQRSAEISKQMSLQTASMQGILRGKTARDTAPARVAAAVPDETGFAMIS